MGKRTFKPRYKFSKDGYASTVTGIHEDDFEAILKLCAGEQGVPMPKEVTQVLEHRTEIATGMMSLSEKAVRRGGRVTIKFTQKTTAHVVESIFTNAFLGWCRQYDPDHQILVRIDNLLSPNRYGEDLTERGKKYPPAPPPEAMRVYRTLEALRMARDDHRQEQFPSWRGPKRGVFFPVLQMGKEERIARINQTRERIKESKKWDDLFNNVILAKIQKKAEAHAEA